MAAPDASHALDHIVVMLSDHDRLHAGAALEPVVSQARGRKPKCRHADQQEP